MNVVLTKEELLNAPIKCNLPGLFEIMTGIGKSTVTHIWLDRIERAPDNKDRIRVWFQNTRQKSSVYLSLNQFLKRYVRLPEEEYSAG